MSLRVRVLGFRVQGSGFRVQGSRFRVEGSGLRVGVPVERAAPSQPWTPPLPPGLLIRAARCGASHPGQITKAFGVSFGFLVAGFGSVFLAGVDIDGQLHI